MSQDAKIAHFRELHREGCFVLPNPWDRGSAKWLEQSGYEALATTSAGFAFALGRRDSPTSLDRELVLSNVRGIVEASTLPVTADFQSGFGTTADEVGRSVERCVETGVAGLSIEDATGDPDAPLFPFEQAVSRVAAARAAIDATGHDAVLTARAECYLVGHSDPRTESLRRLVAYAEAGADCVYAPGPSDRETLAAIVSAVAPLPVNVLARPGGLGLEALRELGVRRVSVGSAFARVAWRAFIRSAEAVLAGGFETLGDAEPFATLDAAFSE